jgi:hypothetical protein
VGETAQDMQLIWVKRKLKYFSLWGFEATTTPYLARRARFFFAEPVIGASSGCSIPAMTWRRISTKYEAESKP